MSALRTAALGIGKTVLVLATILCLLSIGGAMLFAFPVLVPLHWLAMKTSDTSVGVAGWSLLASMSLFEAGWMLAYIATDHAWFSVAIGALAAGTAAMGFLREGTRHAASHQS